MRFFIGLVTGILILASAVFADTFYVKDIMSVTMRTGPGLDHKIIGMIKSGQALDVLETDEKWVHVRLPDGREGWVLKQVITEKIPNCIQFEKVKNDYQALMQKTGQPLEDFETLEQENKILEKALRDSQSHIQVLQESYNTLMKESEKIQEKKEQLARSEKTILELNRKIENLESEVLQLQKRQVFRWFFSGSAVLLIGFFLGFNARYQRRRSGLLS